MRPDSLIRALKLYYVTAEFSIKDIAKVPRKYFHLVSYNSVGRIAIKNVGQAVKKAGIMRADCGLRPFGSNFVQDYHWFLENYERFGKCLNTELNCGSL